MTNILRGAGAALALLLAGCASQNAANNVALTEVLLTGALNGATIYQHLPPCPQPSGICSDPAVVTQIKTASLAAYNAVKAAEADPTLNGAAVAAVQALTAMIPKEAGGK